MLEMDDLKFSDLNVTKNCTLAGTRYAKAWDSPDFELPVFALEIFVRGTLSPE
jgi:hypothetical protein